MSGPAATVLDLGSGIVSLSVAVARGPQLSWVPDGARGWEASHVYLVRTCGSPLLIDTGCALHGPALSVSLRSILTPGQRVRVVLTRIEPDCLGNLARLVGDGLVEEIASTSPFDLRELLHLQAGASPPIRRLEYGWSPELGIEVCRPPLRTLATSWFWRPKSRSLWCSDTFGWAATAGADDPPIECDGDGGGTRIGGPHWCEDLRPFLLAKFDWLARADLDLVEREVVSFFATRDPGLLMPTHGCVTTGRPARRMVSGLREELRVAP